MTDLTLLSINKNISYHREQYDMAITLINLGFQPTSGLDPSFNLEWHLSAMHDFQDMKTRYLGAEFVV